MDLNHVISRHKNLVILTVILVLVLGLLYALRSMLLPFLLGLALAYVILPVITWLEKRFPQRGKWLETRRVLAILTCYAGIVLILGVFAFLIFTTVTHVFSTLTENATLYFNSASDTIKQWTESFRQLFPLEMRARIDSIIQDLGTKAFAGTDSITSSFVNSMPRLINFFLGLAAVPFFLFYILKDRERIANSLYSSLPVPLSEHVKNIVAILNGVIGRYIRSWLFLGLVVGTLDLIGLLILQIPFAPILAVFAGMTEVIPTIGPWIGGAVAVLVTLAVAPAKVAWVAVWFLGVQLLENIFLVPRIQSSFMKLHPALVILLLVLGAYLAGFWGLLLAVPLTAAIVEMYRYVHGIAVVEDSGHLPTS